MGSWNDILSKKGKNRAPEKNVGHVLNMELRMYYRLTRYFSYMKKKLNKFPDLTNKIVSVDFLHNNIVDSKPLYM